MYRWRLWDVSWVFLVLKVIVWHMEQRKIPGTRNLVLQQNLTTTNLYLWSLKLHRICLRSLKVWDWILQTIQSGKSWTWWPESQEIVTYCSWVSILQNLSRLKSLQYVPHQIKGSNEFITPKDKESLSEWHIKTRITNQCGPLWHHWQHNECTHAYTAGKQTSN